MICFVYYLGGSNDIILKCLTAANVTASSAVVVLDCKDSPLDPTQLFLSVRPLGIGSHHFSSVGDLRLAANPNLCVARSESSSMQPLSLQVCDRLGGWNRYFFEFELIPSS